MPAQGDARVVALLLEGLQRGPRDVLEILQLLAPKAGRLVGRHEGRLHVLLHDLLRRGRIHVAGVTPRGLARYAAGAGEGAGAPVAAPDATRVVSPRAQRIASGVRAPVDRSRIEADVAAHLEALAEDKRIAAFGPSRNVRHLLRRVDRKRPVVLFPEGAGDHVRKFLVEEGPWIVAAIVAFLVIRTFLAEVFYIPSESMVPTLLKDDRVVVFKPGARGRVPERWSIVTFDRDGTTFVKRVIGLGGEAIVLLGGDPYADGELLVRPADLRAALRAPYRTWEFGPELAAPEWSARDEDGARVYAYAGPPLWSGGPGMGGRPRYVGDVPLRDVYARLVGERPAGGRLDVELAFVPAPGVGVATPSAARFVLRVADDGVALVLRTPTSPDGLVVDTLASAGPVGPTVLDLAYVDGELTARVNGGPAATRRLAADRRPPPTHVVRPAFAVGGGARLASFHLDKDHHYTEVGQNGVASSPSDDDPMSYAHRVADGSVFLLGDNSYSSNDSRFRAVGDIPVDQLIGPVVFRIWPLPRIGLVR